MEDQSVMILGQSQRELASLVQGAGSGIAAGGNVPSVTLPLLGLNSPLVHYTFAIPTVTLPLLSTSKMSVL